MRSCSASDDAPVVFAGWTGLPANWFVATEPESAVGPLMKLFQSGRLPVERQATVVEMICNRGNQHDLKVVFDKVTQPDGFAPELQLKAMQWLTDAAVTRKVKPAGELSALEKLVVGETAAKNPARQQAAIRPTLPPGRMRPISPLAAATLAIDDTTRPELRRVAIEGLVAIGDHASQSILAKLITKDSRLTIRMQAAAGLSGMDLPAACHAAAIILADATPKDDPDEMLAAFLDRKDGANQLAAEIAKQKLIPDVAKRSLRYMYSVGRSDAALSDVLGKAAGIAAEITPSSDTGRGGDKDRRRCHCQGRCHARGNDLSSQGPELHEMP